MSTRSAAKRVFLSYSNDSRAHVDRVLELANRLRSDGIDARLDRYEQGPSEGWPHWMLHQVERADAVLVVCTARYRDRSEGKTGPDPGFPRNSTWENWLLSHLALEHGRTYRFAAVLMDGAQPEVVPVPLRGQPTFTLPGGYQALCDWLASLPVELRRRAFELRSMTSPFGHAIIGPLPQRSQGVPPALLPARMWAVPELPAHYVPRKEVTAIVDALLSGGWARAGITSEAAPHPGSLGPGAGMSGVGKTVLAAAVARSPRVRAHFTDGIYWLNLGKTPELMRLLKALARELGVSQLAFHTPGEGKRRIKQFLEEKEILLVLDDVWEADHAAALDVLGTDCRLIITTRFPEVVAKNRASEHRLGVFQTEQAMALLSRFHTAREADEDAMGVVRACGHMPLALALAGALARERQVEWAAVLAWLEAHSDKPGTSAEPEAQAASPAGAGAGPGTTTDAMGATAARAGDPQDAALSVIHACVRALDADVPIPDAAARYADLAIFDRRGRIPRTALRVLWTRRNLLAAWDVQVILRALSRRQLASFEEHDVAGSSLRIHWLCHTYLGSITSDLEAMHRELVDAYEVYCGQGWASGPADGYFFKRLPYHLIAAGRSDVVRNLLTDYVWLDNKLRVNGPTALASDYDLMRHDSELALVGDAFWLASHALARDPDQLPSQIMGRLGHLRGRKDLPGIQHLLETTQTEPLQTWLCPLGADLMTPGGPLLRTLTGHSDSVNAVAVTPDGTHAISASYDQTLRVWHLDWGTELRTLTGHSDWVWAVAVTPDGKRVVSASIDKSIKVWDLHSGRELGTLSGHEDSVLAVALTPDGKRAVSASDDQTIKVWDLESRRAIHTLLGHRDRIWMVAITPDGARAVSASSDTTIKIWDIETGRELRTLTGHTDWVVDVDIVTDPATRRVWALSASHDQTIRVWDIETGEHIGTLAGRKSSVMTVSITPDGTRAVSASREPTIDVWDLATSQEIATLTGHASSVMAVAITPDGTRAVSASHDHTLKVWDLGRCMVTSPLLGHAAPIVAVALMRDPETRRLCAVSASHDHTIKLWDVAQGREMKTLTTQADALSAVAVTPDGKHAVLAYRDRLVEVWDLRASTQICILSSHSESVVAAALTPDGKRAVLSCRDNSLELWDLDLATKLKRLTGHAAPVLAVALTPDGTRALSASLDQTMKLWDLQTGKVVHTLTGHFDSILSVAITADGTRALSASIDQRIKLWDLRTGEEILSMAGHSDAVWSVAVTADGTHALSASIDQTLKLWDLATGLPVVTFIGDWPMRTCAISPEGDVIAAGDQSGRLHFLQLNEGATTKVS